MWHNLSENKYFKAIFLCTIAFLLFLLSLTLRLDLSNYDDSFFVSIIKHWNIIDFLSVRYNIWSGRIPIEAIVVCTINYSFFWKICIPLSLLLLSVSISRFVAQRIILLYTFCALILLLLIPASINENAAWWISGFYFYLLPLSLATYALSFLFLYTQSKKEFVLVCLTTFVFSYSEQIGIYFLFIAFVGFILSPIARNYKNYSIYILVLVNYLVLITAPGNYARLIKETWSWFPDYSYYSFLQKLCFGFDKVHQLFVFYWNVPLIVFIVLLIIVYTIYGIKSFVANISLGTIIIYTSASLLQWGGSKFDQFGDNILNSNLLNADKWSSISTYVSYFFIMLVIISIIVLVISSFKNNIMMFIELGVFIVGILDTLLIGFSPTVYASSVRTDYVFEVCCVINCIFLIHYLYQYNQKDSQQTI